MARAMSYLLPSLLFIVLQVLSSVEAYKETIASILLSQELSPKPDSNVILSAFGLREILAHIYIGTNGESAKELESVLELRNSDQSPDETLNIFTNLHKHPPENFKIFNHIYVSKKFPIVKEYLTQIKATFQTFISVTSFQNHGKLMIKVHDWVMKHTAKLIDYSSFDKDAEILHLNAAHFSGKWKYPFDKEKTVGREFTHLKRNGQHKTVTIKMMSTTAPVTYGKIPSLDATAVELNFENSSVSIVFIVPDNDNGLSKLEDNLRHLDLRAILNSENSANSDIELYLPKFHYKSSNNLRKPLHDVGIKYTFEYAEFRKITSAKEGILRLRDVYQETKIAVFEKRIKIGGLVSLGSATEVNLNVGEISNNSTDKDTPKDEEVDESTSELEVPIIRSAPVLEASSRVFFVNRTFIYAIKDANHVYFVGRYA